MEIYDSKKNSWIKISKVKKLLFNTLIENDFNNLETLLKRFDALSNINQTIYFKEFNRWLTPFEYAILKQNEPLIYDFIKNQHKYMLNINHCRSRQHNNIFHQIFRYTKDPNLLNDILKFVIENINFDLNLLSADVYFHADEPLLYAIDNKTFHLIERQILHFFLDHANIYILLRYAIQQIKPNIVYILLEYNPKNSETHITFAKDAHDNYNRFLEMKKRKKTPNVKQQNKIEEVKQKCLQLNQIIYYLEHWKNELLPILWNLENHQYDNFFQWVPREIMEDILLLIKFL